MGKANLVPTITLSSQTSIKWRDTGKIRNQRRSIKNLTGFSPGGAIVDDPINQSLVETDIATGFFRFDPFMFEDLLALSLEFLVKGQIPDKLHFSRILLSYLSHSNRVIHFRRQNLPLRVWRINQNHEKITALPAIQRKSGARQMTVFKHLSTSLTSLRHLLCFRARFLARIAIFRLSLNELHSDKITLTQEN